MESLLTVKGGLINILKHSIELIEPRDHLQVQIAGTAERVAQAAQGLSSLASVLPASGQLLPSTVMEADTQEVR